MISICTFETFHLSLSRKNPWGLNKDFLLLIMQITRELPDYCQPVRRSRRIVAALSPDYSRQFNRS